MIHTVVYGTQKQAWPAFLLFLIREFDIFLEVFLLGGAQIKHSDLVLLPGVCRMWWKNSSKHILRRGIGDFVRAHVYIYLQAARNNSIVHAAPLVLSENFQQGQQEDSRKGGNCILSARRSEFLLWDIIP